MGFDVEVHQTWFKANEDDPDWLMDVGRRNWRPFTSDHKLISLHRAAIIQGNVGLFVLADLKQHETYEKWAEMIRTSRQRIIHACTQVERPFVARINRDGKMFEIKRLSANGDQDVTAETAAHARGFQIE